MAIEIKINNHCASHCAISFFDRYKESFGNVIKAEMISDPENTVYKLILINDKGEEININGECTAGYIGEGPSATFRILRMAGFEIDKEFIINNSSFKLTK